jgi:hypothetical protein
VVWVESRRTREAATFGRDPEWDIRQSFEKRAECVAELSRVKNEREEILQRRLPQMNDTHLIEPPGSGFWHVVYRCLPDTVDPRGPKGK